MNAAPLFLITSGTRGTGLRVSDPVRPRLALVDLDRRQSRLNQGKGKKDRLVPVPSDFKETLATHSSGEAIGSRYRFRCRMRVPMVASGPSWARVSPATLAEAVGSPSL